MEVLWLRLNTGPFGSVLSVGNQWVTWLEETAEASGCTCGLQWHEGKEVDFLV